MWRHQLDGLSDAFRVIAVDLPGHGALADVPFRLRRRDRPRGAVIDAAGRRPGHRRRAVAGRLRGDGPRRAAAGPRGRASSSPTRPASRGPSPGERRGRSARTSLVAAGERAPRPAAAAAARRGRPATATATASARGRATRGSGGDGRQPATNGWLFKGGTRALVSALREVFMPRLAAYPGPTLIVNGEDDDALPARRAGLPGGGASTAGSW